jgi:hypothetical protein
VEEDESLSGTTSRSVFFLIKKKRKKLESRKAHTH